MSISITLDGATESYKVKMVDQILDIGGVYFLYDVFRELIYVGRSANIKKRIKEHLSGHSNTSRFHKEITYFKYIPESSITKQMIYEIYAINVYNPRYNEKDVYNDYDIETEVIYSPAKRTFVEFVVNLLKANRNVQMTAPYIRAICKENNIKTFDFYAKEIKKELRKNNVIHSIGGFMYKTNNKEKQNINA